MRYFALILLVMLSGCAYTSHTTADLQGKKIKSVYVVGDEITAKIDRTMTWRIFHK